MSDSHKAMTIVERTAEQVTMSPVVAAGLKILEHNPNPETLRELLAVQREFEANEARKAYAVALVALKRDLPTVIARDKMVDFAGRSGQRTTYTHASLAAVMDAVTEPLTQHGFSLAWHPTTTKDGVTVTCRLSHAAGHHEETAISAPVDTSGSKSPAQGVASTITLLQRYSALSMLGIATSDMKEPEGEKTPDPAKVDSARNLRAVGRLKQYGRTCEEAEAFLGRAVPDWTVEDLARLFTWAKSKPKETEAVNHASDCATRAPGGGTDCDCGATA
jgi:hypothetical protein